MQHISRAGLAVALLFLSALVGTLWRVGPGAPAIDTLAQVQDVVVPTAPPTLVPVPNATLPADQAPGLPVFLPSEPLGEGEQWITDEDLAPDHPLRPWVDAVYVDPLADVSVCTDEMLKVDPEATLNPDIDIYKQPIGCKLKMFRPRVRADDPSQIGRAHV